MAFDWGEIMSGGPKCYALYGIFLTLAVGVCVVFRVFWPAVRQIAKWANHEPVSTKFGCKTMWNTMVPIAARLAATQLPRDWMVTVSPLVSLKCVLAGFALAHSIALASAWIKTYFKGFTFNEFARKTAFLYAFEALVYIFLMGSSIPEIFFPNGEFGLVAPAVFNMTLPWLWILLLHSSTARGFMDRLFTSYTPNVKDIYADIA